MSLDIKKSCSFQIYITDNSSPSRILSFKEWSCSPQLMLMLSCCVLVWCSTLHRSTNQ